MAFKLATKAKSLPLAEPVFPTPRLPSPPLQLEPEPDVSAAKATPSQAANPGKEGAAKQAKMGSGSRWEKVPGQDAEEWRRDRLKEEDKSKDKRAARSTAKDAVPSKESKPAKEKDVKASKSSKDKEEKEGGKAKARESKADKSKVTDPERGRERSPKKDKKVDSVSKSKRKRSQTRYQPGNHAICLPPPQLLGSACMIGLTMKLRWNSEVCPAALTCSLSFLAVIAARFPYVKQATCTSAQLVTITFSCFHQLSLWHDHDASLLSSGLVEGWNTYYAILLCCLASVSIFCNAASHASDTKSYQ